MMPGFLFTAKVHLDEPWRSSYPNVGLLGFTLYTSVVSCYIVIYTVS